MKRNIIVKFLNFCSFAKQIILRYLKKPYFIWGLILLLCSILDIWGKVGYGNGVGHRRYIIYSVFISAILSFCIVFLLKKRGLILYLLITVFSILFSLSHLISHICFNQELTGNVYMLILGSSTEEMTAFVKMLAVAPFFWLCLILFGAGIYGLYLLTRYTVKKSTCCICTKNRLKKQTYLKKR